MTDAIEAARRLLELQKTIKPTPAPGHPFDLAFTVARALLAQHDETVERCARIAEAYAESTRPETIARSIRALRSKP